LVHDALEKAKREASAKNAKELGLPDSRMSAGQPFRARRQLHPVVAAATAAALTLGAVGAYLASVREKKAAPTEETKASMNGKVEALVSAPARTESAPAASAVGETSSPSVTPSAPATPPSAAERV